MKESELDELKARLTREKEALQTSTDAERKRLKAELAALQEQLDEQTASVARLRKDLDSLRGERDELSLSLEAAERARQSLDKTNRTLSRDLKDAQTALAEEGTKARYVACGWLREVHSPFARQSR